MQERRFCIRIGKKTIRLLKTWAATWSKNGQKCSRSPFAEVRPFCWTDLTIRLIVMGPVLNRAHSVQLFLDPILVVVTQIFIKFFQEVLD